MLFILFLMLFDDLKNININFLDFLIKNIFLENTKN